MQQLQAELDITHATNAQLEAELGQTRVRNRLRLRLNITIVWMQERLAGLLQNKLQGASDLVQNNAYGKPYELPPMYRKAASLVPQIDPNSRLNK